MTDKQTSKIQDEEKEELEDLKTFISRINEEDIPYEEVFDEILNQKE